MALLFNFITATAQVSVTRLAFISDIDSSMTHLYVGESDYDHIPTYYPFDLNEYIKLEFQRVFDTINAQFGTNYEFMNLELPVELNTATGLLNFSGKPKRKLKKYIEDKCKQEHFDYVLILTSQSLNPNSRDAFLNAYDYGLASYINYNNLLTYFTLIEFFLYSTDPLVEINYEYRTNYMRDVKVFDFRLDENISLEERKTISVDHLEFATENIKEMTSIKIEKILKALLRGNN